MRHEAREAGRASWTVSLGLRWNCGLDYYYKVQKWKRNIALSISLTFPLFFFFKFSVFCVHSLVVQWQSSHVTTGRILSMAVNFVPCFKIQYPDLPSDVTPRGLFSSTLGPRDASLLATPQRSSSLHLSLQQKRTSTPPLSPPHTLPRLKNVKLQHHDRETGGWKNSVLLWSGRVVPVLSWLCHSCVACKEHQQA